MKYNVKYEVKDVEKIIDGGLTNVNTESEMDCVSLKTRMREWFSLPSESTTMSEVIELNGNPLLDTDMVPFNYSSLRYKLTIKSPFSVKEELRKESVKATKLSLEKK
jgi:hypothetical protein